MSQTTPDSWIERSDYDLPYGPLEDEPEYCRHGNCPDDCYLCWFEYKARYQLENQKPIEFRAVPGDPPWCETTESTADEWEQISEQIDFWADMDREYWRQRKQIAYEHYLNRQLQRLNQCVH